MTIACSESASEHRSRTFSIKAIRSATGTSGRRTKPAWDAEAVREDGIMALVGQPVGKSPPGAGVDEESHPPATDTAASESPATTA